MRNDDGHGSRCHGHRSNSSQRLSNKLASPGSIWSMEPTPLAKSSSTQSARVPDSSAWVQCVRIKAGKRMTPRPLLSVTFRSIGTQEIVICPMGKQSRPWKPSKIPGQADTSSLVSSQGLCGVSCSGAMYPEHNRSSRSDLHPKRNIWLFTRLVSANTPSVLQRTTSVEQASRNHLSSRLCLRHASNQVSGPTKDPFASSGHRDGDGSPALLDWIWKIPRSKRASHTSLGLNLRPDSPTTLSEHTPIQEGARSDQS